MNPHQQKPQMSQGMLQRLMNDSNNVNNQTAPSVFGNSLPQKPSHNKSGGSSQYQKSMLGSQYSPRRTGDSDLRKRRKPSGNPVRVQTGQNRPSAGFKEPSARGYNPYS